ncbi:MAG: thiamine phosphate synthase [Butyricicoccus sp.]
MKPIDYTLYIITDRTWLAGASLAEQVAAAIEGGATVVQIREKHIPTDEYIARAREIKAVCDRYGVPLIINDSVAVAQAVGAGVHLGASDGDIAEARRILGPDALIGATAKTIEAAKAAERAGANYLGSGAVFGSTTKTDAKPMTIAQFSAICKAVSIPVVAIGGVSASNARELAGAGMAGLCVISAVFAQPDVRAAAQTMRALAEEVCR